MISSARASARWTPDTSAARPTHPATVGGLGSERGEGDAGGRGHEAHRDVEAFHAIEHRLLGLLGSHPAFHAHPLAGFQIFVVLEKMRYLAGGEFRQIAR